MMTGEKRLAKGNLTVANPARMDHPRILADRESATRGSRHPRAAVVNDMPHAA
jgi:hypothetical protein